MYPLFKRGVLTSVFHDFLSD